MTLDSSGNLGLGVTPSAWTSAAKVFEVGPTGSFSNRGAGDTAISDNRFYNGSNNIYKTTNAATIYSLANGQHRWFNAPSGTAGDAISFSQVMTLDASGQLAIGTTSINEMVRINGSSNSTSRIRIQNQTTDIAFLGSALGISGSGNANDLMLSSASTNNLVFGTNTAERARITSGGELLVGGTSAVLSSKFLSQFDGNSHNGAILNETASTASATFLAIALSGTAIGSVVRVGATSAVIYNTTSDQRLKSNIQTAAPVLEKLMQVQVRQYDWTVGDLHQEYGFVAQELEPVLSGVVTKGKTEEDMWQLDYSRLTPHLVKAIQELKAEFDAYKASHP
jgi:hypothetical protein